MLEAHRSPEAMARVLVRYIPCDRKVRSEILTEFLNAPGLRRIAEIREMQSRPMLDYDKYDERGFDWRGEQMRADADIASQVFVAALLREAKAA
ncbi:hypothetical protein [Novosphingobium sp. JCM 18896]|uniref:hypothetical protein n=1 Tax=Novosphingobium sp. JCM 18896 TaxID=2989731 RepID=UPI002221BC45|nr:hypothetical protein [Novosphingobium sp. JCM 18896]MCW1431378.1 hypothetical protein [Novosphingobium sp. JCM 18896]